MTNKQIELRYERELRLLEGWVQYREMTKDVGGEAGKLQRKSIELRIAECNARLEKLETMRGVKNELVS